MKDNDKNNQLSVEDIMLKGVRDQKSLEDNSDGGADAPTDDVVEPAVEPAVEPSVSSDSDTSSDDGNPADAIEDTTGDAVADKPVDDEPVTPDKIDDDWDNEPSDKDNKTDKKIDINIYQELGTRLNLGDISTKEDFVNRLEAKDKKASEEYGKKFDSIPKDLRRAIEVADQGGDYMSLLSEVNYNNIDAKSFFIEAAKEHFIGEDGKLDSESLQEFIDTQDPKMIDIQGSSIKRQYVEQQEAKKEAFVLETRRKKELTEVKLKTALKEFDYFNDFKVSESAKSQLYKDITTGKAMKEMFYDKNGEYDMGKVINAYFYYLKGERMESFRSQRAKNDALRSVIDDASNADLTVNGRKVTDNAKVDRPSPMDLYKKHIGIPDDIK